MMLDSFTVLTVQSNLVRGSQNESGIKLLTVWFQLT